MGRSSSTHPVRNLLIAAERRRGGGVWSEWRNFHSNPSKLESKTGEGESFQPPALSGDLTGMDGGLNGDIGPLTFLK